MGSVSRRLGLAASARSRAKEADIERWEEDRLVSSGVARRREVSVEGVAEDMGAEQRQGRDPAAGARWRFRCDQGLFEWAIPT